MVKNLRKPAFLILGSWEQDKFYSPQLLWREPIVMDHISEKLLSNSKIELDGKIDHKVDSFFGFD